MVARGAGLGGLRRASRRGPEGCPGRRPPPRTRRAPGRARRASSSRRWMPGPGRRSRRPRRRTRSPRAPPATARPAMPGRCRRRQERGAGPLEAAPVEGAAGAADRADEGAARALEDAPPAGRWRGGRLEPPEQLPEAPVQVDPVVAVADGGVEIRQALAGRRDAGAGQHEPADEEIVSHRATARPPGRSGQSGGSLAVARSPSATAHTCASGAPPAASTAARTAPSTSGPVAHRDPPPIGSASSSSAISRASAALPRSKRTTTPSPSDACESRPERVAGSRGCSCPGSRSPSPRRSRRGRQAPPGRPSPGGRAGAPRCGRPGRGRSWQPILPHRRAGRRRAAAAAAVDSGVRCRG